MSVSGYRRVKTKAEVDKAVKSVDKTRKSDIIKLKVNLFDKSDQLYLETFSIDEETGFEDVCLHGNSSVVQMVVNGKSETYTAKEFAKYLKEETKYKGGDIRLASCSTGKGDNSFAQQLSKELGVRVKAPDDDLYYSSDDGVYFIGCDYANTGKWRIFNKGIEE